jgi:hypothetical protein
LESRRVQTSPLLIEYTIFHLALPGRAAGFAARWSPWIAGGTCAGFEEERNEDGSLGAGGKRMRGSFRPDLRYYGCNDVIYITTAADQTVDAKN